MAAAIERHVLKLLRKEGGHIIVKKVAMVSTFMGVFFAVCRAEEGEFIKAFLGVAPGAVADISGPGTLFL